MSKQERDVFFSGRKDANGKTVDPGVVGIRGTEAANAILETMRRLQEDHSGRAK